jgi:hypothetical protein
MSALQRKKIHIIKRNFLLYKRKWRGQLNEVFSHSIKGKHSHALHNGIAHFRHYNENRVFQR